MAVLRSVIVLLAHLGRTPNVSGITRFTIYFRPEQKSVGMCAPRKIRQFWLAFVFVRDVHRGKVHTRRILRPVTIQRVFIGKRTLVVE